MDTPYITPALLLPPPRCPMPKSTVPTVTYISADLSPKRQRSELLGQEITELYGQSA